MDLIVTHTNADFDALASLVAAGMLFPGSVLALPGGADRNVREFLSLHGDVIDLTPPQDVPVDRVSRLIVVETQHARRIGRFAALLERPGLPVLLYDHHEPIEPTIPAGEAHLVRFGANVTQMVGLLRAREIEVDAVHATLFALGIYEDTGNLTFDGTTPEDVETVAWLLRRGASLDMVAAFANRALTDDQRLVLEQLLASAEMHMVRGVQVLLATADSGAAVEELSLVVHRLRDVESSDAAVALFQLDHSVLLVARSSVDAFNAGALARRFGGGGHDRAASATLHRTTTATLLPQVVEALHAEVRPPITAAALMSSPVRTITPDTTVEEALRLMLRYGHAGLTVVEGGRVVGLVSRRDMDRAQHHGFAHAPVRGYLHGSLATITPDTPLPDIERLMIERDQGRLPVLRDGALVGIVTRGDVLKALHGARYGAHHTLYLGGASGRRNLWAQYQARVPEAERALLARIADIATTMHRTIYLVGGAVRDLLLGAPTIDLDILVEGEGIPLAEAVGAALGGRVTTHPAFHTGKVALPDGRTVDFATARTEYYEYPAALPTAEHSSVREDLYRRDFTINAMAMALNGDEPGELLDPFGGGRDLAEGHIRALHTLSFVEDPTRILRAVRFEARLGFRMETRTEELARHAVEQAVLDHVSGPRLREEFYQLAAHPHMETGLRRLDDLGVLAALESDWRMAHHATAYARLEEALAWAHAEPAVAPHLPPDRDVRLLLPFASLSREAAARLAERLRLPKALAAHARRATGLPELPARLSADTMSPSAVDDVLRDLPESLCLVLLALSDDARVRDRVREHLLARHTCAPLLTGADLLALDLKGPRLGEVMRVVRAAQRDGEIHTREEALALARTS